MERPVIVNYSLVHAHMAGLGYTSNYYNSGSFSFPRGTSAHIKGWISGPDASIRAELATKTRLIGKPEEEHLRIALDRVWHLLQPGRAWLMPVSHWHYELHFGSADWLGEALRNAGIEPANLKDRADASAIQFQSAQAFSTFVVSLFTKLAASDFAVVFPDRPMLATVHHHRQVWWISSDAPLLRQVDRQLESFTNTPE